MPGSRYLKLSGMTTGSLSFFQNTYTLDYGAQEYSAVKLVEMLNYIH